MTPLYFQVVYFKNRGCSSKEVSPLPTHHVYRPKKRRLVCLTKRRGRAVSSTTITMLHACRTAAYVAVQPYPPPQRPELLHVVDAAIVSFFYGSSTSEVPKRSAELVAYANTNVKLRVST